MRPHQSISLLSLCLNLMLTPPVLSLTVSLFWCADSAWVWSQLPTDGCQPICVSLNWTSQSQSHIAIDGQSVSKLWCRAPSGAHCQILITLWQLWSCFVGRPIWREDGSVFYICCWPLLVQSFLGPSPLGLATIFYCLRFETSLFVTSYDLQSHGGGIWSRLHMGKWTELSDNSLMYSTVGSYREHLALGFVVCVREMFL
jgi:hypothetical protein